MASPLISYQSGSKVSEAFGASGTQKGTVSDAVFTQGTFSSSSITAIGYKTNTLAAGASDTVDLTAMLALDGATAVNFAFVYYIDLQLTSTSAGGYLRIGNAASNANTLWFGGTTPTADVNPGGPAFMQGGNATYKVTVDATHKNIKILNNHGTLAATYVLRVGGTI